MTSTLMQTSFLIVFLTLTQTVISQTSTVNCVVQAHGTGLNGKGIRVRVNSNGFFCGPFTNTPIIREAKFFGEEAEVEISIQANQFQLCMQSMNIWVTVPYSCDVLSRLVTRVEWGNGITGVGTCRILEQQCGGVTSAAAIPYIDMWCRRPISFGGNPEEMRMEWAFPVPQDTC